jgi:hypothetical protein
MHKRSYKKKTSSGSYRYYSRTGKRISSKKYYSRLKSKRPTVTQENYKGKYASGKNYIKKVKIMLNESTALSIVNITNKFFMSVQKRFKGLRQNMYFNFKAQVLLDTGERVPMERNSSRSFVEEYSKEPFRLEQINEAIQSFYDLLNSESIPYNLEGFPDEIILRSIEIHQRKAGA